MENSGFSQNKWKYATIAVLGVLAIVITTPQATGATDNTQLVQQILNVVKSPIYGNQAIMNAINGLSGSTASVSTDIGEVSDDIANLETRLNTGNFSQIQVVTVSRESTINQGQAFDEFAVSFKVPAALEGKLLACEIMASTEPEGGALFIILQVKLNNDAINCSHSMDVTLNPGDTISVLYHPPDPAVGSAIIVKTELTAWMQLRPAD